MVSTERPVIEHRVERALAYMVAGVVIASIAAFIAVMIGTFVNAGTPHWAEQGIWPFVLVFPLIGSRSVRPAHRLLIVNGVRRRRDARQKSS